MSLLISAVVSTYNRRASLMRCLDSLERQTLPREQYEIIVIDDCSPDDTAEWMQQRPTIRFVQQPTNRGIAASRNEGIRQAQSDWVLILDDDLVLMPDVLEKHVQAHREQPGEHIAVLGNTRQAPDMEVTPLMHYLEETGLSPLVNADSIENPNDLPFGYLATNVSLPREFLIRVGMFDEVLFSGKGIAPYGEDTELGYRLKQAGMRLIYREDIVADHYSALTYPYARRRAKIAGCIAVRTHRKHPEWINIDFLNYGLKSRSVIQAKRLATENLLDPVLITADQRRWDHPLLRRAYLFALGTHQLTAMLDAVKTES
ncbi:MAG TPA: glycosyltransferase family 2 protein [Anaerolineae bacterium]|nr:glycosyltransferase family 2 protein [Anaerolineae bacterium]